MSFQLCFSCVCANSVCCNLCKLCKIGLSIKRISNFCWMFWYFYPKSFHVIVDLRKPSKIWDFSREWIVNLKSWLSGFSVSCVFCSFRIFQSFAVFGFGELKNWINWSFCLLTLHASLRRPLRHCIGTLISNNTNQGQSRNKNRVCCFESEEFEYFQSK